MGTANLTHKVATIYSIQGDVMVNEKAAKPKQKLKEGDVIKTTWDPPSTAVWKWSIDSSEYKVPFGKTIVIQDPTEFPGGIEDITPRGEKKHFIKKIIGDVDVNGAPAKLGRIIRVGDKIILKPKAFLALIRLDETKSALKLKGVTDNEYRFSIGELGEPIQVMERKVNAHGFGIQTSVSVASVKG